MVKDKMLLSGLRILVVEDEWFLAILVEEYLINLGCEVVASAARLEDALEKARTLSFDIALLDVNLAGRFSYPVAEVLRERDVPFVFVTGYGLSALPGELPGALRDTPVLAKPFVQDELAKALQAARHGFATS